MSFIRIIQSVCVSLVMLVMLGAGPVGSGVGKHGWCVYRNSLGQLTLVHLAPRSGDEGVRVDPGTAFAARSLNISPEAIATHGTAVTLVFPPTLVNEKLIRRVSAGRAVRDPLSSSWLFDPPTRLNSRPTLPGEGELVGAVSPGGQLHALVQTDSSLTLYRLDINGWVTIKLPVQSSDQQMILARGDSVLFISRSGNESSNAWLLDDAWNPIEIYGIERVWDSVFVIGHGNELVVGSVTADRALEIRALRSTSDLLIQTITDPPEQMGTIILEGSSTLILASRIPGSQGVKSKIRLNEIDLSSGRVLHDGAPIQLPVLIANTARFLLMLFFSMGSLVVLIVIRPVPGGVFLLPDGCSIAEPTRRMVAMLIDISLLSVVIGPLFGVGFLELFTGSALSRNDIGMLSIPSMLSMGLVFSTVFESTLGATPGKLVMRMRVMRAQSGEAMKLPVHRVLMRNLIKWLLPPVAMLSIVDPGFRHRADVLARAVVTVQKNEPEKSEPEMNESEKTEEE